MKQLRDDGCNSETETMCLHGVKSSQAKGTGANWLSLQGFRDWITRRTDYPKSTPYRCPGLGPVLT